MMIPRLLALFLYFLPSLAIAESILVRSGEHGEFSRLVLRITPDVSWRALEEEGKYTLKLPDHQGGFDTNGVFQRISNDRIAKLSSNESELSLFLNCECDVKTFRVGSNFLVMDVFEGNTTEHLRDHEADTKNRKSQFRFGAKVNALEPSWSEIETNQIAEVGRLLNDLQAPIVSPPHPLSNVAHFGNSSPNIDAVRDDPAAVEALDEARGRLVEEFGSASTRGLLRVDASNSFPQTENPDIDLSVFDSSQELYSELSNSESPVNIRVTSSSDIEKRETDRNLVTTLGVECIKPSLVDVAAWGVDNDLPSSLGIARASLFGEFDIPNEDAVIQLARLYIYFGFGAEALSTLGILKDSRVNHHELFVISEILEYGIAKSTRSIVNQVECNSSISFWATLSQTNLPSDAIINVDAILLTLNGLPLHLRRIFAPELSNRLLRYGNPSAAKMAMRSIERLPEEPDMSANMAQAELELTNGEKNMAEVLLEEVVESNSVQSARALITLIDLDMDGGKPIDTKTAQLAEAYSLELRDHQLGQELRRVHVLALAKSGQYDASFREFMEIKNESSKDLFGDIIRVLTEEAPDNAFLKHIFESQDETNNSLESTLKMEVADRLLVLGFAIEALKLLESDGSPISTKRGKILRATASLSLEKPRAALSILFEVDGREAASLRAQARSDLGEKVEAHRAFEELDDTENAEVNAWLSESWREILTPDNAMFGPLVTAANTSMPNGAEVEGLLSRTEDSLDESEKTRIEILEMINGTQQSR